MRDDVTLPPNMVVPEEYNPAFFRQYIRELTLYFQRAAAKGPISVSRANISNLPTSSTGLRAGDLWNDAGTVKIVT